ncbi:MAG: SGNH/GDSL hydrolase family protein [Clostridia bacterium]|nr:SGNH/GDSL hydrolase family protein [Clostridia bacterium]
MRIVFFGDSITDCDRDRQDPKSLGCGYAKMLADKLRPIYPDTDIDLINKGVSGDEVSDLLKRVDGDVIALEPDVVVMMIGINNTIHQFKNGKILDFETFRSDFRELLTRIKASGCVLIFLEPFLLPAPDKKRMRPVFAKELQIINDIGLEIADEFVAYDEMFNGLCQTRKYTEYSEDGVHPTYEGSMIIADQAIKAIRKHLM